MAERTGTYAEPVRTGVIGLGNMGQNHVRVLNRLPGVDLRSVADPSEAALDRATRSRSPRAYTDYTRMLAEEDLELVVVAVPTYLHVEVAVAVLERGLHILIEKPLAADVAGATRLVELAATEGRVASVGHVERYNPALLAAKRGLRSGELGRIFQVRANRTGPLPARITDVGVVTDLATHDFDAVRYLVDRKVERVFAETARRMHRSHEDLFSGLMRFDDRSIALFDVNWLTPVKIREMRVVGEGGMYVVDLLGQNFYFHENADVGYWSDATGRQGVSEGNMVRYRVDRAEPLETELTGIMRAIRGETFEYVSMLDGLYAVALADAVKQSSELHEPVVFSEPARVLAARQ